MGLNRCKFRRLIFLSLHPIYKGLLLLFIAGSSYFSGVAHREKGTYEQSFGRKENFLNRLSIPSAQEKLSPPLTTSNPLPASNPPSFSFQKHPYCHDHSCSLFFVWKGTESGVPSVSRKLITPGYRRQMGTIPSLRPGVF